MIFAAGVAVGIYLYGVSEPLYHRDSLFYPAAGYRSQDEIDMFAINQTVVHWGISGWIEYATVAVAMGLAHWRFDLPATFRSIFYPILGDYIYGWIGDVIDSSTIVLSIAGLCTSLGLGAIQIVEGFKYLGWTEDIASPSRLADLQNIVVWWVTILTGLSVMSGVNFGIKYLAIAAVFMGFSLLVVVFVMDDTKFILNLQVQEAGSFSQLPKPRSPDSISRSLRRILLANRYLLAQHMDRRVRSAPRRKRSCDRRQCSGGLVDGRVVCVLSSLVVRA